MRYTLIHCTIAHCTLALLFVIILGLTVRAHATDPANPETQMDVNNSAGTDFQAADRQLNAVYQRVLGRLRALGLAQKRLGAAERAWLQFRDAECGFATTASEGGSAHAMLDTMCRTRLTQERVAQLTSYLHCQEGDLSCPVPPQ
jgi:uncharacterized protein YecT (DUF1311 family)